MTALRLVAALALVCVTLLSSSAEARQPHRTYAAHPDCNVTMPCDGVAPSVRGERIVRGMGGFGSAQKVYTPRAEVKRRPRYAAHRIKPAAAAASIVHDAAVVRVATSIEPHPAGCPSRLFCGCGAAVRIFGKPIRELWLAANWFKFPRSAPAAGMVAVRRHHVFVLEAHLGGNTWQVYDANSGGRKTRIHSRSIAGYTIVNPHGRSA